MNSDISDYRPTPDIPINTDRRPLGLSVRRGVMGTCPACGAGPLMHGYLTVRDSCATCGQELHHHRADDGPAYLTMLVVLKTVLPLMVTVMYVYDPDPLILFTGASLALVALSLFLLPRFKGMIVAIQYACRMHGFDDEGTHTDDQPR